MYILILTLSKSNYVIVFVLHSNLYCNGALVAKGGSGGSVELTF